MSIDLFKDVINPLKKEIDNVKETVVKETISRAQYYSQSGNGLLEPFFDKGASNEYSIYKIVARLSDENNCIVNCYIPKSDGSTSEIDVILIHSTGIYVFESKNYKGYIFGSESNTNWTVTLNGGRSGVQKYHFYNPIMQNRTHINWLKKYLGMSVPFYSYIVFGNNCEFKSVHANSQEVKVCHSGQLRDQLIRDMSYRAKVISDVQMSSIYTKLDALCHKSKVEKAVHVEEIKNKSNNVATGICPRCGGKLVLRTARTGANAGNQFYGCSSYPRCKYTANIYTR